MAIRRVRNQVFSVFPALCLFGIGLAGCSTLSQDRTTTDSPATQQDPQDKWMSTTNLRIQDLESRLDALTEKVDSTRIALELLSNAQKAKPTAVIPPVTQDQGRAPSRTLAKTDPEIGFVQDDSIQDYRSAMITFEAKQYPEAMLVFSDFVEKYPDHPLAGSAQYYVGRAYFNQKEFKLAIQEYNRVLESYPTSSHIAYALADLVFAEEQVKKFEDAAYHRQLLTSLFPQSPATENFRADSNP